MQRGTVYLIHLHRKVQHAQHYVGFTSIPLAERISRHAEGRGANFLRAVRSMGVDFDCVRHWDDVTPEFERRIKKDKNARRLCPTCTPRKQEQHCSLCGRPGHNKKRCRQPSPVYAAPCPRCLAHAGKNCMTPSGKRLSRPHAARVAASRKKSQ